MRGEELNKAILIGLNCAKFISDDKGVCYFINSKYVRHQFFLIRCVLIFRLS